MKGANTTKTTEVVALQARETGYNAAHEFVIAVVNPQGVLKQFGGADEHIAAELLGIIEEGCALVVRAPESAAREIMEAQAQGEVPEAMPRNISERYGPAPRAPGAEAQKPQGLGQKPTVEPDHPEPGHPESET